MKKNTILKLKTPCFIFLAIGISACGGGGSGGSSGGGNSASSSGGGGAGSNQFTLQAETIKISRLENGEEISVEGLPAAGATVTLE